MPDPQPTTILLVEDDPGHARLIQKNLRRADVTNDIFVLEDGKKASDYIFGEGPGDSPKAVRSPTLIVLDLNLPIVDGFRLLKKIKSNERTKHVPVIILTSSDDDRDVEQCYALGCNLFLTKPVDYDKFSEAIRTMGHFLSVMSIPMLEQAHEL
ncbi:response regulator [Thermodesulfobacteriota bacterium]